MAQLKIPTRTENKLIEHRGTYADVEVEDRPFRLLENQLIEHKGTYDDVEVPLTDYEILEAGGLQVFFDKNGKRVDANWPWTGEDKRKKKPAAKKKAKKRGK